MYIGVFLNNLVKSRFKKGIKVPVLFIYFIILVFERE